MFSWHVAGESLHWDSFEQFCVWQLISAESPDCQLVIPALANLNPEGTCSSGRQAANPQLATIPCAFKHYYCICAITHPLISYAPLFWVLNFVDWQDHTTFLTLSLLWSYICMCFQTLVHVTHKITFTLWIITYASLSWLLSVLTRTSRGPLKCTVVPENWSVCNCPFMYPFVI